MHPSQRLAVTSARPSEPPTRRRIIVVVTVLVLGGGLWWSLQPKVDPRIVGVWMSDNEGDGPYGRRFNSDGTASDSQISAVDSELDMVSV